ncbi:MAG TPA: ribosome silencing factor [Kofleriaceae bacterium]|nr:ribosome silencing factor [Kofleriaceae bacterium]
MTDQSAKPGGGDAGDEGKRTRKGRADSARPVRAQGDDERPAEPRTDEGGKDGALKALALALDKKALEPVLLDVRSLCSYCNYQLVVSGRSDRQVEAISEAIVTGLRDLGIRPLGTEGKRSGQWALLDFGDFLVHVFHHPLREHYDLEGLWVDAPRVPIEVPAEARIPVDQAY